MATKSQELKKELKAAFPGVKFSVTGDHSSIRVRYEDGPARQDVEAVSNSYRNARYCESSGEILSGGNTFVFVERSVSAELGTLFAQKLMEKGYTLEEINEAPRRYNYWLQEDLNTLYREYDATKPEPVEAIEAPAVAEVAEVEATQPEEIPATPAPLTAQELKNIRQECIYTINDQGVGATELSGWVARATVKHAELTKRLNAGWTKRNQALAEKAQEGLEHLQTAITRTTAFVEREGLATELPAALDRTRKEAPTPESEKTPAPKQSATPRKPRAKTAGLSVIQAGIEVTESKEKNGIEIRIAHPDSVVMADLQSHGFRRSRTHGCWYAPLRDDTKAFAYSLQLAG
jgi:hypothetical protein